VVCLLAANRGPNCSLTRAIDGRIVRCGIISSCQSAATSEIVKHFWSRWLIVTSAIAGIGPLPFFTTTVFKFTKPARTKKCGLFNVITIITVGQVFNVRPIYLMAFQSLTRSPCSFRFTVSTWRRPKNCTALCVVNSYVEDRRCWLLGWSLSVCLSVDLVASGLDWLYSFTDPLKPRSNWFSVFSLYEKFTPQTKRHMQSASNSCHGSCFKTKSTI